MTTILSEPPRKSTSLREEELLREYGDVRDVRLTFGLREIWAAKGMRPLSTILRVSLIGSEDWLSSKPQ